MYASLLDGLSAALRFAADGVQAFLDLMGMLDLLSLPFGILCIVLRAFFYVVGK